MESRALRFSLDAAACRRQLPPNEEPPMTGQTSQIAGLNAYVWDVEGPPLAVSRDASDLVG